jgi:hypothetical protein
MEVPFGYTKHSTPEESVGTPCGRLGAGKEKTIANWADIKWQVRNNRKEAITQNKIKEEIYNNASTEYRWEKISNNATNTGTLSLLRSREVCRTSRAFPGQSLRHRWESAPQWRRGADEAQKNKKSQARKQREERKLSGSIFTKGLQAVDRWHYRGECKHANERIVSE